MLFRSALAKTPGMPAFLGALNVGDNIGAGVDTLEIRASEQLPYGVVASVPAIAPNILASGRLVTTPGMSASVSSWPPADIGLQLSIGGWCAGAPRRRGPDGSGRSRARLRAALMGIQPADRAAV